MNPQPKNSSPLTETKSEGGPFCCSATEKIILELGPGEKIIFVIVGALGVMLTLICAIALTWAVW